MRQVKCRHCDNMVEIDEKKPGKKPKCCPDCKGLTHKRAYYKRQQRMEELKGVPEKPPIEVKEYQFPSVGNKKVVGRVVGYAAADKDNSRGVSPFVNMRRFEK